MDAYCTTVFRFTPFYDVSMCFFYYCTYYVYITTCSTKVMKLVYSIIRSHEPNYLDFNTDKWSVIFAWYYTIKIYRQKSRKTCFLNKIIINHQCHTDNDRILIWEDIGLSSHNWDVLKNQSTRQEVVYSLHRELKHPHLATVWDRKHCPSVVTSFNTCTWKS